jgi:hypothetical protein
LAVLKGILAAYGVFEPQVHTQFLGVARRQPVDHLDAYAVDVHQAHLAARQAVGQAQVLHQDHRELGAAGTDDPDPNH